MKVKRKDICQTCRRRKLGCDGKRPECSQCTFSGLTCDGYSTTWTFVPQSASASASGSSQGGEQAPIPIAIQGFSSRHRQLVQITSTRTIISQQCLNREDSIYLSGFIVQNYVPKSERAMMYYHSDCVEPRICGSWVEVLSILPCLATGNPILPRAIKALAVSLLPRTDTSQVDCLQNYQAAIHMLRQNFEVNNGSVKFELIPAIMCLILMELMIPDSAAGIAAHIKAVEQLMQAFSPDAHKFKTGIFHRLFVGIRPSLVIQSLQDRRPTFLALPSWIKVPFSVTGPSIMQRLLNEVVKLPFLLHQTDILLEHPQQCTPFTIEKTLGLFLKFLAHLDGWIETVAVDEHNFFWQRSDMSRASEHAADGDLFLPLYYSNVTTANVFTHLWAFQIVCITEIERLVLLIPHTNLRQTTFGNDSLFNIEEFRARMIVLARQICRSMDYLLLDDMELFGPASTFYPLRVAYQILKVNEPQTMKDIANIENIVGRLARKGLLASRALILS